MKKILITGADKGIGFATARRLVAAGHRVWVGSRDVGRGRVAAAELGVETVQLDVTDDVSVAAAVETIRAGGGLDVLVNNAGVQVEITPDGMVTGVAGVTVEMLRETFETNVFGVVRTSRAFLPVLLESSAPVVVNVSSGLASLARVSTVGTAAYAYPGVAYPVSKTAVNAVTVHFAKAYPAVRINAVEPGFTGTDLNHHTGTGSVDRAGAVVAGLAVIGPDGPTGGYFDADGPLPW